MTLEDDISVLDLSWQTQMWWSPLINAPLQDADAVVLYCDGGHRDEGSAALHCATWSLAVFGVHSDGRKNSVGPSMVMWVGKLVRTSTVSVIWVLIPIRPILRS